MELLSQNNIPWKLRLKELFIDYLIILAYLLVLLGVHLLIYFGIFGEIPEFNETQSQLVATFTSVIPIILIFSVLDFKRGTIGKRKAGLVLAYKKKSFVASLLRNIIKFLPWQLAHIGVVRGVYTDFDIVAIIFTNISMIFLILMLVMGFFRKDKRHLGDLLAGTQVQLR